MSSQVDQSQLKFFVVKKKEMALKIENAIEEEKNSVKVVDTVKSFTMRM